MPHLLPPPQKKSQLKKFPEKKIAGKIFTHSKKCRKNFNIGEEGECRKFQ
jgi:hypothetical protein